MSHSLSFFRAVVLAFCVIQVFSHHCIHDKVASDVQINDPEYSLYEAHEGRILKEYKKFKILVDYSTMTGVDQEFKDYIVNNVMPAVTNYIEATLKVPVSNKKLRAGNAKVLCDGDVTVPKIYSEGVDADFVLFLKAKNQPSASYVASGGTCLLDTTTRRPIIGRMTYNLAKVSVTPNDVERENDIVTTLHELTHALGFSGSLYDYYVNPTTGKDLTGHVFTKKILGLTTTILNLEPLTKRLRAHFNCSTIEGAYLENEGGSGSAGSHFERRIFYNEYMTGSTLIDARISEFGLALLEGTGWYQVNYNMAEPITWGKNRGCDFIKGPCVDKTTKKPTFDEFCPALVSKGCSWTRRAGSSCGSFKLEVDSGLKSSINWWSNNTVSQDPFSDNCPIQISYSNLDCENSDNQDRATISTESYGYGSKCFMGTLYPGGKLSTAYPFCFKSSCEEVSPGNYNIKVKIGSKNIICTRERAVSVPGYSGQFSCPDPQEFCQQVMTEGNCRRGCSGRGTCVNRACKCTDGWSGNDCSKKAYDDNCSRCAKNNPFKTSCYGDSCECNPNNVTCMCLLGLKTGSACKSVVVKSASGIKLTDISSIATASNLKSQGGKNAGNITSPAVNTSSGVDITHKINNKTTETTPQNPSVNNNNTEVVETIDERISNTAINKEDGSSSQNELNNRLESSNSVVLPVAIGFVGGVLVTGGIVFIIKYAKNMKGSLGSLKSFASRRPKKLKIPKKVQENQESPTKETSPDLSRRGPGLRHHTDSPLINLSPVLVDQSPPRKALRMPSIFKNYVTQKNTPEKNGFGLNIQPVPEENKVHDFENPKSAEKGTIVEQDSPMKGTDTELDSPTKNLDTDLDSPMKGPVIRLNYSMKAPNSEQKALRKNSSIHNIE